MAKDNATEEVVEVKPEVTLTKDGLEYTLTDPVMIAAFKNQGFEAKE
jgi:hypothetical protein|nr:MAG TPA: hypothetical protein [Caudoviricetes sp.]DAQ96941.1 MAG TPA: hypothetical protein [Caudoviricetes sp.]